jgi:hypothetical protein
MGRHWRPIIEAILAVFQYVTLALQTTGKLIRPLRPTSQGFPDAYPFWRLRVSASAKGVRR